MSILKGDYKRIISTVPSQTELLYDLGLEEEVIGITAYCVHPAHWLKKKKVIGGTKDLNIKLIRELKPDLIIANKEENIKEQIELISEDTEVYVSDIKTPEDAIRMIQELGEMLHRDKQAYVLTDQIHTGLEGLNKEKITGSSVYLIWKDPWMAVSNDTYIQSMIDLSGLHNILPAGNARYPEVTLEQLAKLKPDVIFLSSEPFQFNTSHLSEVAKACPDSLIKLIDGEMMSWYGSRLVNGLQYVRRLREEVGLVMDGRRMRDSRRY